MSNLEERLQKIEDRNKLVETNKAWEGSLTRKGIIALFTYIVIGLFMWVIGVENPFINAIIPTTGFILSTLSLPFIKKYWIEHLYRK